MKERHEIFELLGSGGFGSVYKARDTHLGRDIAIKRLRAENYTDHLELRDQLLAEAKILAGLRHPNIVTIHDVLETDEGGDIIMELIDGSTIDDVVKISPLSVSQFVFIATQLLSAMTTAHENDVLHGDLKSANVMLTKLEDENYQATIIDFGISPSLDTDTPVSQTKEQLLIGSVHFMSPEQLDANITTTKSDVYALGCLFYFMLTGQYPFQGDNAILVMASHMTNKFQPLVEARSELPEPLCQWVESHLSLDPDDRLASCRESLDMLFQLEGLEPVEHLSNIYKEENMTRTGMIRSLSSVSRAKVHISNRQHEEFAQQKRPHLKPKGKDLVPLSDRYHQARPESLWYFSIDDQRKGPVHFSKICELIAQGYVRSNDPIWHPRIGQWTPANQVPEFKEEFNAAKSMPPRPKKKKIVSARNSARVQVQKNVARISQINKANKEKSKPIELAITVALTIIAAAAIYLGPVYWQIVLLSYAATLAVFALLINRVHMLSISGKWLTLGLFLPVLSDLIFAMMKPKKGVQSLIMFLLGLAFFYYVTQHRYTDDYLTSPMLSFMADWLDTK